MSKRVSYRLSRSTQPRASKVHERTPFRASKDSYHTLLQQRRHVFRHHGNVMSPLQEEGPGSKTTERSPDFADFFEPCYLLLLLLSAPRVQP